MMITTRITFLWKGKLNQLTRLSVSQSKEPVIKEEPENKNWSPHT